MTYRWMLLHNVLPLCFLLACEMAQNAEPADFDELITGFDRLSSQERQERVDHYIATNGSTPVVEGNEAIFLAQGEPSTPPRILDDFNAWGRNDDGPVASAGAMTPIGGTDWYYLRRDFQEDARIEYSVMRGEAEELDPNNPSTTPGFEHQLSELAMPAYLPPPEFSADASVAKGQVAESIFKSRILSNERKILVYLPSGYEESDRRYPSIYIGDGALYAERGFPALIDYAIEKGLCRPLIAVFVDPVIRREEYRMHDGYRRFMTEELVPFIDESYRTLPEPNERAILGASRGGLAAANLAYSHPEIFGFAAALTPAIRPTHFNEIIASNPARPVRFFLMVGLYDTRWAKDGFALRDALVEGGYDFTYLEVPEGHNLKARGAQFDEILADFFPSES